MNIKINTNIFRLLCVCLASIMILIFAPSAKANIINTVVLKQGLSASGSSKSYSIEKRDSEIMGDLDIVKHMTCDDQIYYDASGHVACDYVEYDANIKTVRIGRGRDANGFTDYIQFTIDSNEVTTHGPNVLPYDTILQSKYAPFLIDNTPMIPIEFLIDNFSNIFKKVHYDSSDNLLRYGLSDDEIDFINAFPYSIVGNSEKSGDKSNNIIFKDNDKYGIVDYERDNVDGKYIYKGYNIRVSADYNNISREGSVYISDDYIFLKDNLYSIYNLSTKTFSEEYESVSELKQGGFMEYEEYDAIINTHLMSGNISGISLNGQYCSYGYIVERNNKFGFYNLSYSTDTVYDSIVMKTTSRVEGDGDVGETYCLMFFTKNSEQYIFNGKSIIHLDNDKIEKYIQDHKNKLKEPLNIIKRNNTYIIAIMIFLMLACTLAVIFIIKKRKASIISKSEADLNKTENTTLDDNKPDANNNTIKS